MGSINDVIDAFRRAPTNVDRGTLFEKLMVRFFELDPALKAAKAHWKSFETTSPLSQF